MRSARRPGRTCTGTPNPAQNRRCAIAFGAPGHHRTTLGMASTRTGRDHGRQQHARSGLSAGNQTSPRSPAVEIAATQRSRSLRREAAEGHHQQRHQPAQDSTARHHEQQGRRYATADSTTHPRSGRRARSQPGGLPRRISLRLTTRPPFHGGGIRRRPTDGRDPREPDAAASWPPSPRPHVDRLR